jgi:hypothetical protein
VAADRTPIELYADEDKRETAPTNTNLKQARSQRASDATPGTEEPEAVSKIAGLARRNKRGHPRYIVIEKKI